MRASTLLLPFLAATAYGCQQLVATMQTTDYACQGYADGGLEASCKALVPWFEQYSHDNQNRLGQSAVFESYWCDKCNDDNNLNPRCYCAVRFWRFREWMGRVPDPPTNTRWMYRSAKSAQKVHCD